MADILAIALNAKPKIRTVPVCLDGDIDQELSDLAQELLIAEEKDKQEFSGGNRRAVVKRMDALKEQAAASTVTFHLRRLSPLRILDLQTEHPPRDEDKGDKDAGWNRETYYPALVRETCFQLTHADGTEVDAIELPDEWWTSVMDPEKGALNFRQFDQLYTAAHEVNATDAAAPFLLAASPSSTSNGGASKPRKSGASPRKGSKAGSRAKKPRSSNGSKTEHPGDG